MAIDPSKFHLNNVADTCSVWNVLSSIRLHAAAKDAGCVFCITDFVRYECLIKPRSKKPTDADTQLMRRLTHEQGRGGFKAYSCDIGDLQTVEILEGRQRLGKGELSSIAFAKRIGLAVLTDDKKARKLAVDSGHALAQTTPHLFSWLIFNDRLGDSDKEVVIAQHEAMGRHLAPHFVVAYEVALQCRLNSAP